MEFVVWWLYIQSGQSYVGVYCMLVGSRDLVNILIYCFY